jgi:hypothetical protein
MKITIGDDKDKRYAAMLAFRIHHMLTNERFDEISAVNAHHLWLRWRIDHNLPLKEEEWELHADCWVVWIESTCIFHDGKYIGELQLIGPPSPEVAALLPKAA